MATDGKVTLTIDGQRVETTLGKSVLEAALDAGIYIPNLCYSPKLEAYGGCRLCICSIEGMRGLPTACTTRAADGMVVRSDVEEVNRVRRMILELMVSDHPADCLVCPKNQACELQKVARFLGVDEQHVERVTRAPKIDDSNPFFTRDMSKCILCGKCVRVCHEVRGVGAIDFFERGFEAEVGTFGGLLAGSHCESCGACVDICPVSALLPKQERVQPTREVTTVCPYCGCGCGLVLGVRGNRIVRVRGEEANPASRGDLCVKGRFGLDFVHSPNRLKTPLIRRDGKLVEATWEEAMDFVATRLAEIRAQHGPDAIAGYCSAKCTNEENYLFQKLMRAALGTNHIAHCAHLCHGPSVAGLAAAFGSGAMTNSIAELEGADCIFVIGSNTTEAHPIIALRIKAAVAKHGANLIVADPRRIELTRFATLHLRQRCGSDIMLINAIMNAMISENIHHKAFIAQRTENFDEFWAVARHCTPEVAALTTGVPAEDIRRAARLLASAQRPSIVYAMGITQHATGTDNVKALANLSMLISGVGRESTGVNPLRGQNNVQGASDAGAMPFHYPGYMEVDKEENARKWEQAWNVEPGGLSRKRGLTTTEILANARPGGVRALYIMGENPMMTEPNLNATRRHMEQLEFIVAQDVFINESGAFADVFLPAASWAEKDGTFTNTDRRVQRVRAALAPRGNSRADWQIICDLADRIERRLGRPNTARWTYQDPEAVFREMADVAVMLKGVTYARIDRVGLQYPVPDENHPGTPFLFSESFPSGRGRFFPLEHVPTAEEPDDEYPFILTTGRLLEHWHGGSMTRNSQLDALFPEALVELHELDAARCGVKTGDVVRVSSRRGSVVLRVKVSPKTSPGVVFIPMHFAEAAANLLTIDALDPHAKIPEFKACAVNILIAHEDELPNPEAVAARGRY